MKYLVEFLGIVAWWLITGTMLILAGYNWFDGHGIGWFLNIIAACIFGKFCSAWYVDYKFKKDIYSIFADYGKVSIKRTRWITEYEYYGGGEMKDIGRQKEQVMTNGIWVDTGNHRPTTEN